MYKALIDPVIEIIQRAADVVLEVYNDEAGFDVTKKGDDSPLTIADQRANAVIVEGLQALSVQFPIISEENKLVGYDDRKGYDHYWLVDPLDGTKEFIKRNGEFTVNIALVRKDRPVMGFVSVPVQNKLYWGVKAQGAFCVENGETRQLKATPFRIEDEGLRVVTSRSHLNSETQDYVASLNNPSFVPTGSSLKFMLVAEGKADVYPRFGPCMEWDTGAAQIILEEAGGSVVRTDDRTAPLLYNKENLLNPYFIAFGDLKA